MTTVDWIAVAIVAVAALNGLRTGLVSGALSLAGIVCGALIGARLAPQFLPDGRLSPYTPLVALGGAVLLAGLVQSVAGMAGGMIRKSMFVLPPLRMLDSLGGLVLGAAAGLMLVWVLGAVALQLPAQTGLRRQAFDSKVLQRLNEIAPPQTLLRELRRIDPFPTITGPAAPSRAPDPAVLRLPGVRNAYPSVVRVTGSRCGLGIEGSGWVARPGLVVTAAHVVAGVRRPRVQPGGRGRAYGATVVRYDRANDVAVLRVRGLRAPALRLVPAREGASVAILGYPENGPFDAVAGRIGRTVDVLPGQTQLPRSVTAVGGLVRHGNSGGPAVDASGSVQTTIFAAKVGARSGYGVPTAVVAAQLARAGTRLVSTGPCTT